MNTPTITREDLAHWAKPVCGVAALAITLGVYVHLAKKPECAAALKVYPGVITASSGLLKVFLGQTSTQRSSPARSGSPREA